MDVSDESGSSGERDDPIFVPMKKPVLILERIDGPATEDRQETSDDTSMSDDSIVAVSEFTRRRKNPERRPVNRNKIVSTDSDKDNSSGGERRH